MLILNEINEINIKIISIIYFYRLFQIYILKDVVYCGIKYLYLIILFKEFLY